MRVLCCQEKRANELFYWPEEWRAAKSPHWPSCWDLNPERERRTIEASRASRRAAMSTLMMQMVGLWILAVLVAWVINEIRDDWWA